MKKWRGFTGKAITLLLAAALAAGPVTGYAAEAPVPIETVAERNVTSGEALAYLQQNYVTGAKIITNGGDAVVKSADGLSYDVGLKTPSGSSISSMRFKQERSTSAYKSGWYIQADPAYVKAQKPTSTRSTSILKRPTAEAGKYTFKATLKLFDRVTTDDAAIDNGSAVALAEQTFTISLAPEEKTYKVSFEAVDKATKNKIDTAKIKVEKGWSQVSANPDGTYSMKVSDVFTVTAEAPGYVKYKNTAFKASKDGVQTLELEKAESYTFRFNVKNSKGEPIKNPEISVTEGYYTTVKPEADGSYKLEKGKKYRYRVSALNYTDASGEISPAADQTIDVVLQKNITEYIVRFDIVDGAGKKVKDAKIEVSYEEYDDWEGMFVTVPVTPEADGSYRLNKNTSYDYTITAKNYDKKTGKINPSGDNENITEKVTLSGGIVVDPADIAKVEAAKKAFDAEFGALRPKFAKNKNINDLVLARLTASGLDTKGMSVEVATTAKEAYIGKDGAIHYVKDDTFSTAVFSENVSCTFKLKAGNAEAVTGNRTVTVGWDHDFFEAKMAEEAAALTIDKLLGQNSSAAAVDKNLTLPQCMGTSARKVWSAIKWESSAPDIITVKQPSVDSIINPATGKVTAPPQDTKVTLTATFTANDAILNSYLESVNDIKAFTKTFEVTVKGNGIAKPSEKDLLAILDKYYTVDQLKDSVTNQVIDPKHVDGDIQLLRYTRIKDENGNLVFKNKEIQVTSSNDKLIKINGYRANVDVFSEENPEVKLLVKFTREGVSVTKEIPLRVAVVTDAELDAEIAKMEVAKLHYFDGINDNANVDKDNIINNLHSFKEMRLDKNNKPVFSYNVKDYVGDGIIPDDFFEDSWEMEGAGYNTFRSSNNGVIQHDNLLVRRPENSCQVTVSSLLSSAKYGKYAPAHPENAKLQKLYKQPVEVVLTVKGTASKPEETKKHTKALVVMNANPVSGTMGMQYIAEVSSDEAEKVGFLKDEEFRYKVTAVDALVYMHREMFGSDFDQNPTAYLNVTAQGWITKIFGEETFSIGYFVNGYAPMDETGTATVANTSVLKQNDVFTVFIYGSPEYDDFYLKFDQNSYTADANQAFKVNVSGYKPEFSPNQPIIAPQEGVKVLLTSAEVGGKEYREVTDKDGNVTFTVDTEGKYILTVESCKSDYFIAPYANVTINKAVAPETEAPETEAPETEAPETEAPETEAPETEAPETQKPETQKPETQKPDQNKKPEGVQTGDHTPIVLLWGLTLGLGAVVVLIVCKKKLKHLSD